MLITAIIGAKFLFARESWRLGDALPGGGLIIDTPGMRELQLWAGEESLDVEAVHAMAPGAHVLYVGGEDCFDENLIEAVNKIVDGNLAQIITNSYGNYGEAEDAALLEAWNDTFRQAALEGIGMYFSSGDNGDEIANIGFAAPDFPASHPLVTAVGGTSLGVGNSGVVGEAEDP